MDRLEEYFRRDFPNDLTRELAENNPRSDFLANHLKDILQRAVRGGEGFYFSPQDLGHVETFVLVGLLERRMVGYSPIYSPTQKAIDLVGLTDEIV